MTMKGVHNVQPWFQENIIKKVATQNFISEWRE